MMNNILFTKTTNKQKNIENAVIYCIQTTESISHGWLHNWGVKNGLT
jgi:hypothetical protein